MADPKQYAKGGFVKNPAPNHGFERGPETFIPIARDPHPNEPVRERADGC